MYVNCMLLVINVSSDKPVCYSSKIVDDLVKEVDKACIDVGIDNSEEEVKDIAERLEKVECWNNDEIYCFQIIPIR